MFECNDNPPIETPPFSLQSTSPSSADSSDSASNVLEFVRNPKVDLYTDDVRVAVLNFEALYNSMVKVTARIIENIPLIDDSEETTALHSIPPVTSIGYIAQDGFMSPSVLSVMKTLLLSLWLRLRTVTNVRDDPLSNPEEFMEAVKQFQINHQLKADGVMNRTTIDNILKVPLPDEQCLRRSSSQQQPVALVIKDDHFTVPRSNLFPTFDFLIDGKAVETTEIGSHKPNQIFWCDFKARDQHRPEQSFALVCETFMDNHGIVRPVRIFRESPGDLLTTEAMQSIVKIVVEAAYRHYDDETATRDRTSSLGSDATKLLRSLLTRPTKPETASFDVASCSSQSVFTTASLKQRLSRTIFRRMSVGTSCDDGMGIAQRRNGLWLMMIDIVDIVNTQNRSFVFSVRL